MKKTLVMLIVFLGFGFKTDKPAYLIYNNQEKKVTFKKLLEGVVEADVILFGELHNNPICHWLQLELTKALYEEKQQSLVLGAEMFEHDNQYIINEYLDGHISEKSFSSEMRLWSNYDTDYKPLVEFANNNQLGFVATNIPRRYASMVYKKGLESLDSLSKQALNHIAPLPIAYDSTLPGYKQMLEGMVDHANPNLPRAQAIKDATMAHFITQNLKQGQVFLHFNGTYHSNNFEGIYWYLKKYKPELKIVTIASVEQADISDLDSDNMDLADFIIAIPENMTKTY